MIGLASGFAWASKEFWNEKKPDDWTAEEIDLCCTNRPGPKKPRFPTMAARTARSATALPGERSRSSRNASSGTSPSAQSPAAWKAIIRWDSALPVRQALKDRPLADADKFYVLNMVGDVPSIGATPDEDPAQRAARFETLETGHQAGAQRRRDPAEPRSRGAQERSVTGRNPVLLFTRPGAAAGR